MTNRHNRPGHRAITGLALLLVAGIVAGCGSSEPAADSSDAVEVTDGGDTAPAADQGDDSSSAAGEAPDTSTEAADETIAEPAAADATESGRGNGGTGTVTVGGEAYTFDLECYLDDRDDPDAQFRIQIFGTADDGTFMSFSDQWGIDVTTMSPSPTVVEHTLSITTATYEELWYFSTLTADGMLLDIDGNTISGSALFNKAGELEFYGTHPGEILLECD